MTYIALICLFDDDDSVLNSNVPSSSQFVRVDDLSVNRCSASPSGESVDSLILDDVHTL